MVITRRDWRTIYRIYQNNPEFCQWEDLKELLENWPRVSLKKARKKKYLNMKQQHGCGVQYRVKRFQKSDEGGRYGTNV